jgi:hypothetical protein
VHDVGYVVAGYTVTGIALAAYIGSLVARARRARLRAAAVASRRTAGISRRP